MEGKMPAWGKGSDNTLDDLTPAGEWIPPPPIVMLGFNGMTPFQSHCCAFVSGSRSSCIVQGPREHLRESRSPHLKYRS